MSDTVGKRIQILRKKRNWTQLDLAEEVGISSTYMGEIERSETNVSYEILAKIAKALDIPLSDLVLYSDKLSLIENKDTLVEIIELLSSRSLDIQHDVLSIIEIYLSGNDRESSK
ncbi:helix-turn-helix transcriptional regulator [Bacillus timonensis]|uniref:helix-turn-helix transcriptional regulator n=1 Tax=Bacillus timonensis TaxID=1033734 RepID=UPI00028998FA|nr:helix-turn-helix transcriptional regulator [Bacillus timonensis]